MAGKSRIDEQELRDLHAKGLHPVQIAESLSVTPGAIITQLDRLGLEWERKSGGKPRSLSDEQEQELVTEYLTGAGATSLARSYYIDKKTVYNILNRLGVGTRSASARRVKKPSRKSRISARDLTILELYKSGKELQDIATDLNVHESTVRYSLRKQDAYVVEDDSVKVRQKPRTNKGLGSGNREASQDPDVRHSAFYDHSELSYYWIGFLLADGCVHQPTYGQPTICINLKESDRQHLEKLKSWIGTCRKISTKTPTTFGKKRRICSLFWRSSKQATALREFGVVHHKERRFVNPFLAQSPAFWRGLLDGDGCLYAPNKGTAYLSGQPEILTPWAAFCASVCDVDDPSEVVRIYDRESVSVGSIRRKEHCRKILRRIYGNASIYLDRKKAIADLW